MTLYEITDEARQIQDLIENAVDENGEPRELNEDELGIISHFFLENQEHFEEKIDSYGKVMANLKLQEDTAKAQKDAYKSELDRLSARARAFGNRRESLKLNLQYAMELLHKDKVKTALFSFNIQNKPMSINIDNAVLSSIPDKYLKKKSVNQQYHRP